MAAVYLIFESSKGVNRKERRIVRSDYRRELFTDFSGIENGKSVFLRVQKQKRSAGLFDKEYLSKLQDINKKCTGAFCGYGVAVSDFQNPVIDFNRNNTYIQSEGNNQDFGIFDSPDEMLKEHHQELSAIKRFAYRYYGRHMMNRNVKRIRMVSP